MSIIKLSAEEEELLSLMMACCSASSDRDFSWKDFDTKIGTYAVLRDAKSAGHIYGELIPLVKEGATVNNIRDFEYKTHVLFRMYPEDIDDNQALLLFIILYVCYLRTSSIWTCIGRLFHKKSTNILSPISHVEATELDLQFVSALIDYICTLSKQNSSSNRYARFYLHKQLRDQAFTYLQKYVGHARK